MFLHEKLAVILDSIRVTREGFFTMSRDTEVLLIDGLRKDKSIELSSTYDLMFFKGVRVRLRDHIPLGVVILAPVGARKNLKAGVGVNNLVKTYITIRADGVVQHPKKKLAGRPKNMLTSR